MTTFQEVLSDAAKEDAALFLGRLAWYQIPAMKVSHAEVVQGLTKHNLSGVLPPYPQDSDVFRRVCTDAQLSKMPTSDPTVFENYRLTDMAEAGEDKIIKRLVVDSVDRKGKKLNHTHVYDVRFHRSNSLISRHFLTGLPTSQSDSVYATIKSEFATWQGMLNGYAIREFVRRRLLSWAATCVRDGLYFLPEDRATELDQLDGFVNGLPGAEFHWIPLLDSVKQREMVRKAFQSESVDAVDKLMGQIAKLKTDGKKITADRYAKIITDYQKIMAKTEEYEKVLDVEMQGVHIRLDKFGDAVMELIDLVKT